MRLRIQTPGLMNDADITDEHLKKSGMTKLSNCSSRGLLKMILLRVVFPLFEENEGPLLTFPIWTTCPRFMDLKGGSLG